MRHVRSVSRKPTMAQLPGFDQPGIDPFESILLITITLFFSDFDNYPQIIQQLQKFYSKN